MSPNLDKPFDPSCCEGTYRSDMSAQVCGCDPGAKWTCQMHKDRADKAWEDYTGEKPPIEGGKMKLRDYEKFVKERSKDYVDLNYCVIALNGEAGEVAEWYKKGILRGDTNFTPQMLGEELGDVLFYLVRLASLEGWSLKDLMNMNVEKLSKRHGLGK